MEYKEDSSASLDRALREIRRLWRETGGDELLPSSRNEELQAYYNATIHSVLRELEQLRRLSTTGAGTDLVDRFKGTQRLMFQQMRLLSNIGAVLLPLPSGQTPGHAA